GVDDEFDNVIFNTSGMPYASLAALKIAIQNPANWYGAQVLSDVTYQGYLSDLMNQDLLPVELLTFDATLKKNIVELYWSTATEINNQGFEIQQSTNNKDWQRIDFVDGKGNSEIIQEYQVQHKNPEQGFNYYRLKQMDYDGAFEYSKIQVVRFNDTDGENEITVYPNPTKDLLQIDLTTDADKNSTWECRIFSLTGELIQQKWIDDEGDSLDVDVSTLEKGFYIIEVKGIGRSRVARFVKE
ncbi:MAG: T9SS type A sorting domain-containing protein, partial [Saprospiraceae bacterium]